MLKQQLCLVGVRFVLLLRHWQRAPRVPKKKRGEISPGFLFDLHWLGFSLVLFHMLPSTKRGKLLGQFKALVTSGLVVDCKLVEQCDGLLFIVLWRGVLAEALAPAIYKLPYKPHCFFRSMSLGHFGPLLQHLSPTLLAFCHILNCWRPRSVGNCVLADIESPALRTPVFYNHQRPTVKGCQASARVSRPFVRALRAQASVPLRFVDADGLLAGALPLLMFAAWV